MSLPAQSPSPVDRLRLLLGGREADIERIAFVATVLFAGATFWFAPRPPMIDLPQHAGQVAAWRDLLSGTSRWEPLLHVNYSTPYLIGYGLALLLSFVMPTLMAMKVLLTLAFWVFVAGCVALRRRFGGDRRLDWLFIPGFFGYAYAWGFYTFLIAASFGVLFILLAHRYAERPTLVAGIALLVVEVPFYFTHGLMFLFANFIGGAFLLVRCRTLSRLLPASLPYVAAGLACVAYTVANMPAEMGSSGLFSHGVWLWDTTRLNFMIYSMSMPIWELDADARFAPLLIALLAAPIVLRARLNTADATALVPFLATLLVWAFVPVTALGTFALYQRFALFLLPSYAFMFRASDRPATGMPLWRWLWLPASCWIVLGIHTERLRAFAAETVSFEEVLAATQPGYRALGLVLDSESPSTRGRDVYVHFPVWYQAEKGGLVDFNFAGYGPPIVLYRRDRAPKAFLRPTWEWLPPKEFEWGRYQADLYRYFFVRHTAPLPQGYFPTGQCEPVLLKSVGAWSVYENVRCLAPGSP